MVYKLTYQPKRRMRTKAPPSVSVAAYKPQRRVRTKQPPPPQASLPEALELAKEASGERRKVYLATLPHPRSGSRSADGRLLLAPGSHTKQQILDKLVDSCRRPAYLDPVAR